MRGHRLTERLVCYLWAGQYLDQDRLQTADGLKVEILFPGHWNSEAGPDFRGARIRLGEGEPPLVGDVEVHLQARDWYRHGHHLDPAYNRVVLQVVMLPPGIGGQREDGEGVPTLVLGDFLGFSLSRLQETIEEGLTLSPGWPSFKPCPPGVSTKGMERIGSLLDQAGDERLRTKIDRFRLRMEKAPLDHVLYQGIMESLGYGRNQLLFLDLSRRVTLEELQRVVEDGPPMERIRGMEALLFGVAGLLPPEAVRSFDQETGVYVAELNSWWKRLGPQFRERTMVPSRWQFPGVRPANFPTRRIGAIAHLLANCGEQGLTRTFTSLLTRAGERGWIQRVGELFEPRLAPSYWSFHYTFGSKREKKPMRLVGRDRAFELVVNIIIPTTLAAEETGNNLGLEDPLRRVYNSRIRLSDNRIVRFMTGHIFGEDKQKAAVIHSSRRQQGLIHIYREFCEEGQRCDLCPLNR